MSIIVEELSLVDLLEEKSQTQPSSTAMLFQQRFPPQFQLEKLLSCNLHSEEPHFQLIVKMLENWNQAA